MRRTITVGVVLAVVGAFVGVTVWMARLVEAQVVTAPSAHLQSIVLGGSRIGVTVRDVDASEAGVRVENVAADSPAAEAGLAPGDVILDFDGERVRSVRQFARLVQETPDGRLVIASVLRDGATLSLEVTPDGGEAIDRMMSEIRRELERGLHDLSRVFEDFESPFSGSPTQLGAALVPMGNQLAAYFGVETGVMVSEVDESAATAGLRAGDVITAIDGDIVDDVQDVHEKLLEAGPGASLTLSVVRQGQPLTLTVTLPGTRQAPGRDTGITRPVDYARAEQHRHVDHSERWVVRTIR